MAPWAGSCSGRAAGDFCYYMLTPRRRRISSAPCPNCGRSRSNLSRKAARSFMLKRVTSSLRILQVTPRYFPLVGGVENHVYQISRRLAQAGAEVTVLTTDPSGQLAVCEQVEVSPYGGCEPGRPSATIISRLELCQLSMLM